MKKKIVLSWAVAGALVVIGLSAFDRKSAATVDQIYINGKVITVDAKNTVAQAIAIKDGKIVAVGTTAEISKLKNAKTKVVDLAGKTLLPGFVDGHSHFMSLGMATTVDLSAPPVGNVKSIPDIVEAIKRYQKAQNIKPGQLITARGYDPDELLEKRHPNKEDLDAAFPDNPIVLRHVSGHMSVVNSYVLNKSNINKETPEPAGGQIVRNKDGEPTGLLLERAAGLIKTSGKKLTLEDQLLLVNKQQAYYASQGITTAQDGGSSVQSLAILTEAAKRKQLYIDVEVFPAFANLKKVVENPAYKFDVYNNGLKIKGTKIVTDGSPQGKTAFFSKPYNVEVPGCSDHCTGIPTISPDRLVEAVKYAYSKGVQTYAHCNGDGAIDIYIEAVKQAEAAYPGASKKLRPVVIHSQFVREDQLDQYKTLGMMPAFFTNHAFFWGDVHTRNLGKDRASFLSPLKSAQNKGIIFSNHTDWPVTPVNQLFLLWTSVNRLSRSNQVTGAEQKLTVLEGIRAITYNGAYQYGEENEKGSLEIGKKADLVILSADILTTDPTKIKDLEVLETIKEGKTIYKKK